MTPYLGEIRMFAGNFAPAGWAFCDGRILSILENDTLFTLIGTSYGGDGQNTFALPDLRGRIPVHMGSGSGLTTRVLSEKNGTEEVALTVNQMPAHTHVFTGTTSTASATSPANGVVGAPANIDLYRPTGSLNATMATNALVGMGGSQAHNNLQPYLCISFIIALYGNFPTQS